MDIRVVALAVLVVMGGSMLGVYAILSEGEVSRDDGSWGDGYSDPLIQTEEHDHRNSSEHNMSSENIAYVDFNELTNPGNAEIQVMQAPDGRTYAYQAGWSEVHITDVTDPYNTSVVGVYNDPNTQVLDVKYIDARLVD